MVQNELLTLFNKLSVTPIITPWHVCLLECFWEWWHQNFPQLNMASPDDCPTIGQHWKVLISSVKWQEKAANLYSEALKNDFHFLLKQLLDYPDCLPLYHFLLIINDLLKLLEELIWCLLTVHWQFRSLLTSVVILDLGPDWYWRLFHIFPGCVLP